MLEKLRRRMTPLALKMEPEMHAEAVPIERPQKLKTKAGNDWLVLDGIDNRTSFARRFKDVAEGLFRDLGIAADGLTDSLKLQIRNAAQLVVQIEQSQAQAASGKPVDTLALVRMQNSLARALWSLGLGRRRRMTLTPEDALDYAQRQKEQAGA